MSDHDDSAQIVEIDFEVGHSSIIRSEPTNHNPPRTHDWKVYLRSSDVNGDLNCLIQRCIFHLHPDYQNNKRELKSTPFAIQETGYAGFLLRIDIYFNTKKEPKKFQIDYELDLHKNVAGYPQRQKESYVRKYRCTFYSPDPEFRQKVLAAGGKIVDSGPIPSNDTDNDEVDMPEAPVNRQSPQQKRPASPVSSSNLINNKKIKLEQPINNVNKKPVQTVANKTTTNNNNNNIKKIKLASFKSSSVLEEKPSKTLPVKESNQTLTNNENSETSSSSSSKQRINSIKLVKSHSTNDIKSLVQSTTTATTNSKKKELISSPSKPKTNTLSQTTTKKPVNKIPQKTLIKSESTVNSPVNVPVKQESPPETSAIPPSSTNTTNSSNGISKLKKIPKKPQPPTTEQKRSQSLIPSALSTKKPVRDSQKPSSSTSAAASFSSKPPTNTKRNHSSLSLSSSSSSSIKDPTKTKSDQPKKPKINKDRSVNQTSKPLQNDQKSTSPSKPNPSPISSQTDLPTNPTIELSQPSPPVPMSQNEDNQMSMDTDKQNYDDHLELSEKSNSPQEQILTEPTKIPYSNQSDMTNDSDVFTENDNDDEEDLPTSLTNDDLRYKLIYIYKRFQTNLINDLITFVRFFKRHQLIDISSLSMTKTSNDMFTYDLFTLSPSHIAELADDLGYSIDIINSIN